MKPQARNMGADRGAITHYVAGMGTGGTISGVAKFLKSKIRILK